MTTRHHANESLHRCGISVPQLISGLRSDVPMQFLSRNVPTPPIVLSLEATGANALIQRGAAHAQDARRLDDFESQMWKWFRDE
jgi:hypothetical protein